MKNKGQVQLTLQQLQNLIKRDPVSYREEFFLQARRWQSLKQVFLLKPGEENKDFEELAHFMSHVLPFYKKENTPFIEDVFGILENQANILIPGVRRTLVQALILLRNRDMITSSRILELCFKLFRCKDKSLREMLYKHIVSDVKNSNAKHKNNKLNASLQNFMFSMLQDNDEMAAKKSLDVMVELYRKRIWNDAKTANIISTACMSPKAKLMATALRFFLTAEDETPESEDEGEEDVKENYLGMLKASKHAKKTSRRDKKLKTALKQVKKKEGKRRTEHFNFSAIQLLNDPEGLAEKMFSRLRKSNEKFEVRTMMMNFISRLIGVHQLLVLDFYSFLQRYFQPQQQDVTLILAIAAQGTHSTVPPEVLEPIVKAIANNFVSDHCSSEAMTVGLNSIREICARNPFCIDQVLLHDLAQYKDYRDKGVAMAAKSLIALFREVNPHLLHKKDRGKEVQQSFKKLEAPKFGETKAMEFIPGTEVLEKLESRKRKREEDPWAEWEEDKSGSGQEGEDEDEDDEEGGDSELEMEEGEEGDEGEVTEEEEEEEEEEGEQKEGEVGAEKSEAQKEVPKTERIEMTRILTQEEFAKLRKLKQLQQAKKKIGETMDLENLSDLETSSDEDGEDDDDDDEESIKEGKVNPESLFRHAKKKRLSYQERMEAVKEGRKDREKFGGKREKEAGSKTNEEKRKTKSFQMIRHKKQVRGKQYRSAKERGKVKKNHATKMKKRKLK